MFKYLWTNISIRVTSLGLIKTSQASKMPARSVTDLLGRKENLTAMKPVCFERAPPVVLFPTGLDPVFSHWPSYN